MLLPGFQLFNFQRKTTDLVLRVLSLPKHHVWTEGIDEVDGEMTYRQYIELKTSKL